MSFEFDQDRYLDPPEDPNEDPTICDSPGRNGCGVCEACERHLDQQIAAIEDQIEQDRY